MRRFRRFLLAPDTGAAGSGTGSEQNAGNNQQDTGNQASTAPSIDYDKIQSMIERGTQQKENAILKSYFQQQGLSEEEARQAMAEYKQTRQSQQPDVTTLQAQLVQAQADAQKATLENAATLEAISMGIDTKSIPYLIKMADFSQAIDAAGKVNQEALKNAMNKVIEDVPALKPQPGQSTGFVQIGASGQQQPTSQESQLSAIFGNKK